jgi:hypothetical protein
MVLLIAVRRPLRPTVIRRRRRAAVTAPFPDVIALLPRGGELRPQCPTVATSTGRTAMNNSHLNLSLGRVLVDDRLRAAAERSQGQAKSAARRYCRAEKSKPSSRPDRQEPLLDVDGSAPSIARPSHRDYASDELLPNGNSQARARVKGDAAIRSTQRRPAFGRRRRVLPIIARANAGLAHYLRERG